MSDVMTVAEVAKYLRIGRTLAYSLVEGKQLRHVRVGTRVLVRREDLETYIAANTVEPEHRFKVVANG